MPEKNKFIASINPFELFLRLSIQENINLCLRQKQLPD